MENLSPWLAIKGKSSEILIPDALVAIGFLSSPQ
jgi:hypothetical protein